MSRWLLVVHTYVLLLSVVNVTGRSGLVVTRLPAAREDPGWNRDADRSLCFYENHCDTQLGNGLHTDCSA